MAYRGIRAATAQMAGRQSFRNTGDVGLSAQVGGPDVARALQILLESLESCGSQACS
ncbi:MAG: hypothetical protein ACLSUZ_04555 [Bifidobacterium pseudocatenulatum]